MRWQSFATRVLGVAGLLMFSSCAAPRNTASATEEFPAAFGDDSFRLGAPRPLPSVDEFVSTVTLGVQAHDVGILSPRDEGGQNANLEILFATPDDFLEELFSPRPHLGLQVNDAGDTDQAYLGLTWDFDLIESLYGALSFGLSVHDGTLQGVRYEDKELGSRVLFRESIELGLKISDRHTLSVMFDHVSNAGLAEVNEGLDTLGIRLGYQF